MKIYGNDSPISTQIIGDQLFWNYVIVDKIAPILYYFQDTPIVWMNPDRGISQNMNQCWSAMSTNFLDTDEEISLGLNDILEEPYHFAMRTGPFDAPESYHY